MEGKTWTPLRNGAQAWRGVPDAGRMLSGFVLKVLTRIGTKGKIELEILKRKEINFPSLSERDNTYMVSTRESTLKSFPVVVLTG